MRTAGKGFEEYYDEARKRQGVRFIRCRPHSIGPASGGDDVLIRYVTEKGNVIEETFDIVVLSVGLETSPEVVELAQNLDIKLTQGRFCETDSFVSVASSKDGIYVCGAFQGPKDIPESVMQASAAAGAAMGRLAPVRNTLVKANCQDYPIQKDVCGKVPRIGVFVCH
jgi:heterodisulfide reductase subunit A